MKDTNQEKNSKQFQRTMLDGLYIAIGKLISRSLYHFVISIYTDLITKRYINRVTTSSNERRNIPLITPQIKKTNESLLPTVHHSQASHWSNNSTDKIL